MPRKKRSTSRKKFSIFSKKALTILSVASFLVLAPLFIYLSAKDFEGITIQSPSETKEDAHNIRSSQESGAAEAATRDENLSEIDNASSELNGKWRGVCAKNSVQTVEDFRNIVENDPVLSIHFAGFNWEKAVLGQQAEETFMYVTHRKGAVIKQTSKPIRLPKGDGYITDGVRSARTYCCNDISLTPSAGIPNLTPSAGSPSKDIPAGPFFTDIPFYAPPLALPNPFLTEYSPSNHIPTLDPTPDPDPDPDPDPAPVPEPGALLLAGIGLIALLLACRKKVPRQRRQE